jgi:hypothetical protein
MKTLVDKIGDFFKRSGKAMTSVNWTQTASVALAVVAPLAESIVAMTAGEAGAAAIAKVVSEIQADLATASGLISVYNTDNHASVTASLTSVLSDVQTNMGSILTAANIKNPATLAKVTGAANTITGELAAILKLVPASPTAAGTTA